MRRREEEWLKRVGNPARLDLRFSASHGDLSPYVEAVKSMKPGADVTIMTYIGSEGSKEKALPVEAREVIFRSILEALKHGTIREYKPIICFDHDVPADDHELKSGILRVGEGLGNIYIELGDHCRLMMETKGCSLYIAPVVLRGLIGTFGVDKVSMTLETTEQGTGNRIIVGPMIFSDPPNGEIVEQFREMERATERRMVAVHKIRFPKMRRQLRIWLLVDLLCLSSRTRSPTRKRPSPFSVSAPAALRNKSSRSNLSRGYAQKVRCGKPG